MNIIYKLVTECDVSVYPHFHMHNIVSKLIPVPNFNSKHLLISALFLLALSELLMTQNIPHIISILVKVKAEM